MANITTRDTEMGVCRLWHDLETLGQPSDSWLTYWMHKSTALRCYNEVGMDYAVSECWYAATGEDAVFAMESIWIHLGKCEVSAMRYSQDPPAFMDVYDFRSLFGIPTFQELCNGCAASTIPKSAVAVVTT